MEKDEMMIFNVRIRKDLHKRLKMHALEDRINKLNIIIIDMTANHDRLLNIIYRLHDRLLNMINKLHKKVE
jgi:hypothetical protein